VAAHLLHEGFTRDPTPGLRRFRNRANASAKTEAAQYALGSTAPAWNRRR
jgi:hypothetical protein